MFHTFCESPVGELLIAGDDLGLRLIAFPSRGQRRDPEPEWIEDAVALRDVVSQLREYFRGERTTFDLKLAAPGTPFQLRVWSELRRIRYGTTISYGELARRIGRPSAARAVGAANGRNPLPIVVPCHRVIGADGGLTGFGGGLSAKQVLLGLERRRLPGAVQRAMPGLG